MPARFLSIRSEPFAIVLYCSLMSAVSQLAPAQFSFFPQSSRYLSTQDSQYNPRKQRGLRKMLTMDKLEAPLSSPCSAWGRGHQGAWDTPGMWAHGFWRWPGVPGPTRRLPAGLLAAGLPDWCLLPCRAPSTAEQERAPCRGDTCGLRVNPAPEL